MTGQLLALLLFAVLILIWREIDRYHQQPGQRTRREHRQARNRRGF